MNNSRRLLLHLVAGARDLRSVLFEEGKRNGKESREGKEIKEK